MKIHQKGYLLVELSKVESIWDDELIARTLKEYGHEGEYWENNIRVALDELAAAGIIARLHAKLEAMHGKPTLKFCYKLSDFGKARMIDTGLLHEGIEA
jgi:DNA-binding transcriptional regulator PaaX